jgi:sulfide dehydrogenase [flavocytochrome c] flavoprotein subunit
MKVFGELNEHTGDVINIIPPQKAGKIAFAAGLVNDKGWCPVDVTSFESTIHKGVHVIGDASVASAMPKSGYSANSQAKACAEAIIALLDGKTPGTPSHANTCYSIVGSNYGISVAAIYRANVAENKLDAVKDSGGMTPANASASDLAREAVYAHSWFKNITHDMFA